MPLDFSFPRPYNLNGSRKTNWKLTDEELNILCGSLFAASKLNSINPEEYYLSDNDKKIIENLRYRFGNALLPKQIKPIED